MERRDLHCEECSRIYLCDRYWPDDRLCRECRLKVTRAIGEPAYDSDLTPEEREFLAESLGVEEIPDDQLKLDAPYCRSCIVHGSNRRDYPCLRKDQCGWEVREERARQAQQQYVAGRYSNGTGSWATNITYNTSVTSTTSNAISNFYWR